MVSAHISPLQSTHKNLDIVDVGGSVEVINEYCQHVEEVFLGTLFILKPNAAHVVKVVGRLGIVLSQSSAEPVE